MQLIKYFCAAYCLFGAATLPAQQEQGDHEVGLGGAFILTHASPVSANAFVQASYGSYLRRSHFVGVTVTPIFSFGGGSGTSVSGATLVNYRYLLGSVGQKVYPFVGAGGGGFFSKGGGSTDTSGAAMAEFGAKYYLSQKTSFEIGYQFLYATAGDGFRDSTISMVMFSLKHLF